MSHQLPKLETNVDLWIDGFVDDELDQEQRRQLLAFLETNGQHWRTLAVSFANHQVFQRALTPAHAASKQTSSLSSASSSSVVLPTSDASLPAVTGLRRKHRRLAGAFAMGLAASLLFFLGWGAHFLSAPNPESVVSTVPIANPVKDDLRQARLESINRIVRHQSDVQHRLDRQRLEQLQSFFASTPTLIQVEDSSQRAVYYSQHKLPEFLMAALVSAGHRINISQEFIEMPLSDGNSVGRPIHSFEIDKFALLDGVN